MPTEVLIEVSKEAQEILQSPNGVPLRAFKSIQSAMNQEMELTSSAIVEKRMSFPRKGPITLEGLRVDTGRLRRSMFRGGPETASQPAEFDGDSITGSVGTNVRYAAIHEYGGTVQRTLRGTSRASTQRFFGKKRTVVRIGFRQAHSATYPARRPIGRTVDERRAIFVAAVSHAILEGIK